MKNASLSQDFSIFPDFDWFFLYDPCWFSFKILWFLSHYGYNYKNTKSWELSLRFKKILFFYYLISCNNWKCTQLCTFSILFCKSYNRCLLCMNEVTHHCLMQSSKRSNYWPLCTKCSYVLLLKLSLVSENVHSCVHFRKILKLQ